MARNTSRSQGCDIDMTPMIDIVFQLIIFFVVTLKFTNDSNMDIMLEDGKNGVTITAENMPQSALELEVDSKGRISMHNFRFSDEQVRGVLRSRVNRMGANFPLLIRADRRTPHEHVKRVMDLCTSAGVWKLSFVALQDDKTGTHKR